MVAPKQHQVINDININYTSSWVTTASIGYPYCRKYSPTSFDHCRTSWVLLFRTIAAVGLLTGCVWRK